MTSVGQVLFAFFEDYLKTQKGLRPGSIRSYRDTMKLFLAYVASSCRRPITRLQLADLSAQRVRVGHVIGGRMAQPRNGLCGPRLPIIWEEPSSAPDGERSIGGSSDTCQCGLSIRGTLV
jgi:hypothetical protein